MAQNISINIVFISVTICKLQALAVNRLNQFEHQMWSCVFRIPKKDTQTHHKTTQDLIIDSWFQVKFEVKPCTLEGLLVFCLFWKTQENNFCLFIYLPWSAWYRPVLNKNQRLHWDRTGAVFIYTTGTIPEMTWPA